jgi:hypothetical protein
MCGTRRKLWPPFPAADEARWKFQSQHTCQLKREGEEAKGRFFFLEEPIPVWWCCGFLKEGLSQLAWHKSFVLLGFPLQFSAAAPDL